MQNAFTIKLLSSFLLASILLTACHPPSREFAVVTGKTVYGEMALENVALQVHRWEEAGWHYLSDSQSGYHGSFRLHLEPGEYLITAQGTLKVGRKEVRFYGSLVPLVVEEGVKRLDQILIRLEKPQKQK